MKSFGWKRKSANLDSNPGFQKNKAFDFASAAENDDTPSDSQVSVQDGDFIFLILSPG